MLLWPLRRWGDEEIHLRTACLRSSVTLKTTGSGWPSATGARLASRSACLDSFQSAANWSGAPTKIVSPSIRQRLGGLEPGLEGLLGQLLASAIEQPAPSFVGCQRHDGVQENRGGGAKLESRMWKKSIA